MDESVCRAWQKGAALFNQGRFWEAHHEWETDWQRLDDQVKARIQGLIQLCGVLYHLEKGRFQPAQNLCRKALEKLTASRPPQSLQAPDVAGAETFLQDLLEALSRDQINASLWLDKARSLRARVGSSS